MRDQILTLMKKLKVIEEKWDEIEWSMFVGADVHALLEEAKRIDSKDTNINESRSEIVSPTSGGQVEETSPGNG